MQVYNYSVQRAPDRAAATAIMSRSLDRWEELIDSVAGARGDKHLLLFPEFCLQGFPTRETAAEWIAKACIEIPGSPEIARLCKKAQQHQCYIGGNAYETDPEWPGRYFNTSFLIDDSGEVILKYRRINTSYASSPHDAIDKYFARYGVEGTFPVAKTPLGNLAMIPCGEIMYPEAARSMMMRGAEVLLHPTSDFGAADNWSWQSAKKVRASENMMYVISANAAGIRDCNSAESDNAGNSRIFDWEGRVLSEGPSPGESLRCNALIDVEMLRRVRSSPRGFNRLAGLRMEMYRPLYNDAAFYPVNRFPESGIDSRESIRIAQRESFANLAKAGIIPSVKE
jgi:predicted amidohydrolase